MRTKELIHIEQDATKMLKVDKTIPTGTLLTISPFLAQVVDDKHYQTCYFPQQKLLPRPGFFYEFILYTDCSITMTEIQVITGNLERMPLEPRIPPLKCL